ncbi:type I phosphomannose isomerase catalytic subunit [Spirosoma spitsbergense]|uniref:type I phosphomannose isomerase catalytic subunit n=1 Tax=Spirosoma spitsbergense TaxID=431554 RepID=UPI000361FB9E|nr:type I phosphomannose isomerase catalytic subunit [Spirosoma spitsbergense]
MNSILYPLKFEPIYQYRLWGGRKLGNLLSKPLPGDEPIGEAWILSDRTDHASQVSEGPLKGYTITQLMNEYPHEVMGKLENRFNHFPLLLKFLDCKEVVSVQVHPSDDQKKYIPKGDTGKTEAWVVLETGNDSRVYAGLKPGTNEQNLREAIQNNRVAKRLHSFVPNVGDAVFIHSGTVHTLGGTVVFEVQENSDVTLRLYDWDRTDPKTGKHRDLQVDEALACIDFDQVDIGPVPPVVVPHHPNTEKLFDDEHFIVWRTKSESNFRVGFTDEPRILVCTDGSGKLDYNGNDYGIHKGDVMLLPAVIGQCTCKPDDQITLLEIAIPATNLSTKLS